MLTGWWEESGAAASASRIAATTASWSTTIPVSPQVVTWDRAMPCGTRPTQMLAGGNPSPTNTIGRVVRATWDAISPPSAQVRPRANSTSRDWLCHLVRPCRHRRPSTSGVQSPPSGHGTRQGEPVDRPLAKQRGRHLDAEAFGTGHVELPRPVGPVHRLDLLFIPLEAARTGNRVDVFGRRVPADGNQSHIGVRRIRDNRTRPTQSRATLG